MFRAICWLKSCTSWNYCFQGNRFLSDTRMTPKNRWQEIRYCMAWSLNLICWHLESFSYSFSNTFNRLIFLPSEFGAITFRIAPFQQVMFLWLVDHIWGAFVASMNTFGSGEVDAISQRNSSVSRLKCNRISWDHLWQCRPVGNVKPLCFGFDNNDLCVWIDGAADMWTLRFIQVQGPR